MFKKTKNNRTLNYYRVTAEVGHFGARKQKDVSFIVWAKDIVDAMEKAKQFPRVTRVKGVKKIDKTKELVVWLVKETSNDIMTKKYFPSSLLYTYVSLSEHYDKLKRAGVLD